LDNIFYQIFKLIKICYKNSFAQTATHIIGLCLIVHQEENVEIFNFFSLNCRWPVWPDDIVSAACPSGENRCLVNRGDTLTADALFTPRFAHTELLTSATAHHLLLPGGGMNVS
jgi:hypothetical protein